MMQTANKSHMSLRKHWHTRHYLHNDLTRHTRDFPLSHKLIQTFSYIRNKKILIDILYWFLLLHVQYIFRQDVDLNLNCMYIP
jgi:hypothetical protein